MGFLKDPAGTVLSGNPLNASYASMRGLKEYLMALPVELLMAPSVNPEAQGSEKEKELTSLKTAQAAAGSNTFVWTRSQVSLSTPFP